MLKYRFEQNHRWAENLSAGKKFWEAGDYEKFYKGDPKGDFPYPGMKIINAFWRIENMEMQERYSILKTLLPLGKQQYEREFDIQSGEFFNWYVEDVIELNDRYKILDEQQLKELVAYSRDESRVIPENWEEYMAELQQRSEQVIESGVPDEQLFKEWNLLSLRYVIGYARNLIRQGTRAALYVKYYGKEALDKSVEQAVEFFSWNINRIFYQVGMPQTGFNELCDVLDMGSYGMMADQRQSPSWGETKDDVTIKYTTLNTCQLYGFFDSTATFLNQPKGCTSNAYCRFCVGHGNTTMAFVVPPSNTYKYYLKEGLGYNNGEKCVFVLETRDGEDDERANDAMTKIYMEEVAQFVPEAPIEPPKRKGFFSFFKK